MPGRFKATLLQVAGTAAATEQLNATKASMLKAFTNALTLSQARLSVPSLYKTEGKVRKAKPRSDRSERDFFNNPHTVEINSVREMLRAFQITQEKHHRHQLVWRGQQDAGWAMHSSLYRGLADSREVDEDRLIAAEKQILAAAMRWGKRPRRALRFFADMQHLGAPTRLIDATLDPEIAAWFAVEPSPENDVHDGLVMAWGLVPRTKRWEEPKPIPDDGKQPFWHDWTAEVRPKVDWGTGTRTRAWFPPPTNERMRAQRAGFLIEAGPIISDAVANVFEEAMDKDWRPNEISRATSVVGLPSRHDRVAKPNAANLVPLFTYRLTADAKPAIREYLTRKGLLEPTIYPDTTGLVHHLQREFGPRKKKLAPPTQP